jgi:hypothetical protein
VLVTRIILLYYDVFRKLVAQFDFEKQSVDNFFLVFKEINVEEDPAVLACEHLKHDGWAQHI